MFYVTVIIVLLAAYNHLPLHGSSTDVWVPHNSRVQECSIAQRNLYSKTLL